MGDNTVQVKVWGEFACFTRPDLKVERMTYPCMTPSAARGVLNCILWKPEFVWHVHRIVVLKPVKFASVKRNEINSKQGVNPIYVDEVDSKGKPKYRAQRNSIILKDVAYIIEASVYQKKPDKKNPPKKYVEMFNRRVRKGQCWRRPFLGTREFAAEFSMSAEDDFERRIKEDIPVGSMFLDMWYDDKGVPMPKFFYDVAVRDGILDCSKEYGQILTSTHQRGKLPDYQSLTIHELNRAEEAAKEEL
ncbi:MAG: type I-C CRISPR-associated protein Cas5c [Bacteroidetes bacterium]|nr:type I-C CRISPR-associated protein Cas5c [Bacteroidota bacterium]MCL5737202.1 type I-C CRISPR-associated protein Cas5c [Bacteroidota bacterium]